MVGEKKRIRLVAMDLDGTLLTSRKTILPATKLALKAAAERGITLTLATGRAYPSAQSIAQDLGIDMPLISYNGALIKGASGKTVYFHQVVPLEIARHLAQVADTWGIYLKAYVDDILYAREADRETLRAAAEYHLQYRAVGDLARNLPADPDMMVAIASESTISAFKAYLRKQWPNEVQGLSARPDHVDITAFEISKGSGLALLADRLSLAPEEVLAIGDAENDSDMLQWAGLGVAMANASYTLKSLATFVTNRTNEDNGVGEALERWVL